MDGRVGIMIALFFVTALAGCAADDEVTEDERVQQQVEQGEAALLPAWQTGQYWTYALSANGTEFAQSSFIVTGDTGSDYILETNDKDVAYFDARFDISFLGEVRKSDLAGSQNGERIAMFQWPLAADMEWTTSWDGLDLTMLSSSMGPNQFHVMGHDSQDRMAVEYHYNGDVQWFEYMVFHDVETETEAFRLDLQDSGDAFTGTVYRYTEIAEPVLYEATAQSQGVQDVTFEEKYTELAFTATAECNGDPAGQIAIGLNSPEARNGAPMAPFVNEPEWGTVADCQADASNQGATVMANAEGAWEVGLLVGAPNGAATLSVEQRALETVAFGGGAAA